MSRRLLVSIHLYLAAFFAPILLMMAISVGLYLLGQKGSIEKTPVPIAIDNAEIDSDAGIAAMETAVRKLLAAIDPDFRFEYLNVKGSVIYTRPTSRTHYEIHLGDEPKASLNEPSLQKRLIELHMGHGPRAFKTFQKAMAAGLILVMLSGLWLGISSAPLRNSTLLTSGAGLLAFLILALI